jgi:hypothetical protein
MSGLTKVELFTQNEMLFAVLIIVFIFALAIVGHP